MAEKTSTAFISKHDAASGLFSTLNQECLAYAKKNFREIDRTSYRVPDVLFPRDGQSGDYLTRNEIKLGLHSKFADEKHRYIPIKKLLEERHEILAVEKIAQRLYNWGTSHGEGMFVICNYEFQRYLSEIPSIKAAKNGDHDIIAIGEFGFVFIQVKACTTRNEKDKVRQISNVSRSHAKAYAVPVNENIDDMSFWKENVKYAVSQLIKDGRVFLDMNEDLEFVKYSPFHFVVGVPEIGDSKIRLVKGCIQEKLIEEHKTDMKVIPLTRDQLLTQRKFNEWFKDCILLNCTTKRYFNTDDIYTLVGRYTNPKYSSSPRLTTPGEGTKRSSTLISLVRFTQSQEKILKENERRQVIAGGYGTGKTFVLIEEAVNLALGSSELGQYNAKSKRKKSKGTHQKQKAKTKDLGNSKQFSESDNASMKYGSNFKPVTKIYGDAMEKNGENTSSTDNTDTGNGNEVNSSNEDCEHDQKKKEVGIGEKETTITDDMMVKEAGEKVINNFVYLISCSNVGENGFVFNDPDLLVEQIKSHLVKRIARRFGKSPKKNVKRGQQGENVAEKCISGDAIGQHNIEVWSIDEVIKMALPDQKSSHSNITCEAFTVEVLLTVIRFLVHSKVGYTCHILLDEFPAFDLVHEFEWEKLNSLYGEFPDMRLWVSLSAEGHMPTYLTCEDEEEIRDTLKIPKQFRLGLLEESKRMSTSVFNFMAKTQEYEGKKARTHFRCGIEISEYTPMWIPMRSCICNNIKYGFFSCTCMVYRLQTCLREIWKRITCMGTHEVYILFHVIMFEDIREKLVQLWTKALREIHVSCTVQVPKLEKYTFKCSETEEQLPAATIIHNRYFHGCEGKVMIIFPPLGGPQFQPTKSDRLSLALPFDSVIARSVARMFIVTPSEEGMLQYSEELCKYIQIEKEKEIRQHQDKEGKQLTTRQEKWDRFLSIFKCRKSLPSFLWRMVDEDVLVRCRTDRTDIADVQRERREVPTVMRDDDSDTPITKWYMTPPKK